MSNVAHARSTDPETSFLAARAATAGLSAVRFSVLDAVYQFGPCTGSELNAMYAAYRDVNGWAVCSWDSPRKRFQELFRDGLVSLTDTRGPEREFAINDRGIEKLGLS
jgi:hypothetical protein